MKLIRYEPKRPPDMRTSGGHSRPQWLKEWLANQPEFVLLSCGCKDDVKIPYTITLAFERQVQVLCDRHGTFEWVRKKLSLAEYVDLPATPIPDEPMF